MNQKLLEGKGTVYDKEEMKLGKRMEIKEEQVNYKLKLRNLIKNNLLDQIKSVCWFKFNDEITRRNVRLEVMKIVEDINPYLAVKCDEENNNINIIENSELMFEIFDIVENETLLSVVFGPCQVTLK